MATRLYLANLTVTGFTPDGSWEKTTGYVTRRLVPDKEAATTSTSISLASQGTSGNDTLLGQWVSAPLDVDQTITGTLKGQARVQAGSAATDARSQALVRIVAPGGTVRGTLLAHNTGGLASEWSTSIVNRKIPIDSPASLTSVAGLAGDRIVVELGIRQHAASASNTAIVYGGESASDLGENETDTAALAPWVEFSQDITFTNESAERVTLAGLEAMLVPADVPERVSLAGLEVLIDASDRAMRASLAGLEVFILVEADVDVDAELASGTGSAPSSRPHVAPNAEAAAGSGAALDATVSITANTEVDAELAAGAGAALGPAPAVAPNAEVAAGSGAALDATASTEAATNAQAELAAGTGAGLSASAHVVPNAVIAAGAGTALDATVSTATSVSAGQASGSGVAVGPTPAVAPNAGLPAGTGAAYGATVSTSTGTSANAELASGTGSAYDATVSTVVTTFAPAGLAAGTGAAYAPRIWIQPRAALSTGAGAAGSVTPRVESSYGSLPEGDIATGYMPPLAAPIDDNDTTLTVTTPSTSTPDEPFVVRFGDEQVLVTNVSGTTWTVVRGYNGTTAAAHGAGSLARPALARITVDGVDVTADVDYRRSRFTTAANGQPGTAEIWVRDLERTWAFTTGAEIVVTFRGIRMWGGYLANIRRQYVFTSGTGLSEEPRYLLLDAVDYNVLFNKRVYFDPGDTDDMFVKRWPNGTRDEVVINELVNNYLTLDDDGLTYDIRHVGTPWLPQASCNPNASDEFGIGNAGWMWGEVMNTVVSQTGAVYYIDPDKVFRHVDDSDKQSRFGVDGVSDNPRTTGGTPAEGPHETIDAFTRSQADGLGGSWVRATNASYTSGDASANGTGGVLKCFSTNTFNMEHSHPLTTERHELLFKINLAGSWTSVGGLTSIARFGFRTAAMGTGGTVRGVELSKGNAGVSHRLSLNEIVSGTTVIVDADSSWIGADSYLRVRVDADRVRGRWWLASDPEPSSWQVDSTPAGGDLSLTHAYIRNLVSTAGSARSIEIDQLTASTMVTIGGAELVGYRDVEFVHDGARLTNDHLQWGAGQGSPNLAFARVTDSTSLATHGRWQTGELRYDMYCQDSIEERAETWVYGSPQNRRGGKDDRIFARFTVREPYFRVADVITVESTEYDLSYVMPIRHAEITFPTPFDIRCVLTAGHELDAPWQTFEFWFPLINFDPIDLIPPALPDLPVFDPIDECEPTLLECVVFDTFTRTGASLGTSDSGHSWTAPITPTNTFTPTTNGTEAVLHDEAGFAASGSETSHNGGGRLNLASEGLLVLPLLASFSFRYTGTWNSTWVSNPVPVDSSDPDNVWAPGFSLPDDPTVSSGEGVGGGYRRDFLSIAISNSIPIYRFHIYNAGGALYAAAQEPSATTGETTGATLIAAQLVPNELCHVKVFLDSDRVYLKVWRAAGTEPSFYQVQTEADGNTWADQELNIVSRVNCENATQPPFIMYIDDLCIGRASYTGEVLALPGFGGTETVVETFSRTGSDLGISEWNGSNWAIQGTAMPTDGTKAVTSAPGTGTASQGMLLNIEDAVTGLPLPPENERFLAFPINTKFKVRFSTATDEFWVYLAAFTGTGYLDPYISVQLSVAGTDLEIYAAVQDFTNNESDTVTSLPSIVTEEFWVRAYSGADGGIKVRAWLDGDPEPSTWDLETAGVVDLSTDYGLINEVNINAFDLTVGGFITLDEWAFDFEGGNPCGGLGELLDPPMGGSATGDEIGDTGEASEDGVIFHTDHQYQRGSSEVWVNGLRIRLGEDYLEYPRSKRIEILDHIDVTGASIRVNYVIWTVENPAPTLEPE